MRDSRCNLYADYYYIYIENTECTSDSVIPLTRTMPEPTSRFAGGIEVMSAILAPTTIITALLVHVGWTRNRSFYGFFGIDQALLNPSMQDYVLRSGDVTFGAVARLVSIMLLFLVLDRAVVLMIARGSNGKLITRILTAIGLIFLSVGLLSVFGLAEWIGLPALIAAMCLGVGAVLTLRFARLLISGDHGASWKDQVALYGSLLLALFWAATLYAYNLGLNAARNVDDNPTGQPLVTIFSKDYLDLPGSEVRPDKVPGPDGGNYYRYTGLSLLVYSNSRLFLLTGRYSDSFRPSVVVLKDSDAIRFEIAVSR